MKTREIATWPFRKLKNYLIGDLSKRVDDSMMNQKLMLKLICEHLAGVQFHGQELQDMYAYLWFRGKRDGFFIDIGAFDGVIISNTYSLEQIGWKGICIEPVPNVFEKLVQNRKCECINAALSDMDSKDNKFIQTQGGRSGFTRNMSPAKLLAAEKEGIVAELNVNTITFDTAMSKYNKEYIDFMSIDVEGSEMEVLKTVNFNKYKFGLITVENNPAKKGEEQLKPFMKSRGYQVLLNVGVDTLFVPVESEIGMYWWKEPVY